MLPSTKRLYWEDDHCMSTVAQVIACTGSDIALDQTCFYAGGGGQPSDTGSITFSNSDPIDVIGVEIGEGDVIWHHLSTPIEGNPVGQLVSIQLDQQRRTALAKYHTVLHVVNTIALRDYEAWITGAQIGVDYSRIDFKIERFSPEIVKEIETKVNAVLSAGHTLSAFYLTEAEFAARPDLLRTLEVKPPIRDGRVRVVAVEGFDEQACGGTHVHNTADIGRLEIYKTENKGKINKRLYLRLV